MKQMESICAQCYSKYKTDVINEYLKIAQCLLVGYIVCALSLTTDIEHLL